MSFVDRSNTNWLPFKSLSNLPPRVVVVGGVCSILAGAGILFQLRKAASPPLPSTMSKEWRDATAEKMKTGFEREAGDPIPLNPITRSSEK